MPVIMRRNGFTVVELMVSLAVLAVLVAIIVPAAMSARESARRMHCQNNLRQIGLGILEYESQYGTLPNGLTLRFQLLPFLELTSIYDQFDASAPANVADAQFHRIKNIVIPQYLCPSDPVSPSNSLVSSSSYPSCFGSGVLVNRVDGAFGIWGYAPSEPSTGPIRLGDIVDGTSNVAAVSEWLYNNGPVHRLRETWVTPQVYSRTEADAFRNTCETLPLDPVAYGWQFAGDRGSPWYSGAFGYGQYNHMLPPNRPSCSNRGGIVTGIYTAGSFHNGGANLLYVDGHVRFESENIDRRVWQRIGSRNDDAAVSPL